MTNECEERVTKLESQYEVVLGQLDRNRQRIEDMNKTNIKTFISTGVGVVILVMALLGLFIKPLEQTTDRLRLDVEQHEKLGWHAGAGEALSHISAQLKFIELRLDKLTRFTENSLRKSQNNSEFFPGPDAGMEIRERRIP